MTRLEKIKKAENAILELEFNGTTTFFSQTLPSKMNAFFRLCLFDDANYVTLYTYLQTLLKRYMRAIESSESNIQNSIPIQSLFLKSCKNQTSSLREEIVIAFEVLFGNMDRLNVEEE